jgi:hypothetical protein
MTHLTLVPDPTSTDEAVPDFTIGADGEPIFDTGDPAYDAFLNKRRYSISMVRLIDLAGAVHLFHRDEADHTACRIDWSSETWQVTTQAPLTCDQCCATLGDRFLGLLDTAKPEVRAVYAKWLQ